MKTHTKILLAIALVVLGARLGRCQEMLWGDVTAAAGAVSHVHVEVNTIRLSKSEQVDVNVAADKITEAQRVLDDLQEQLRRLNDQIISDHYMEGFTCIMLTSPPQVECEREVEDEK